MMNPYASREQEQKAKEDLYSDAYLSDQSKSIPVAPQVNAEGRTEPVLPQHLHTASYHLYNAEELQSQHAARYPVTSPTDVEPVRREIVMSIDRTIMPSGGGGAVPERVVVTSFNGLSDEEIQSIQVVGVMMSHGGSAHDNVASVTVAGMDWMQNTGHETINAGDIVLVCNPCRREGKKLTPAFQSLEYNGSSMTKWLPQTRPFRPWTVAASFANLNHMVIHHYAKLKKQGAFNGKSAQEQCEKLRRDLRTDYEQMQDIRPLVLGTSPYFLAFMYYTACVTRFADDLPSWYVPPAERSARSYSRAYYGRDLPQEMSWTDNDYAQLKLFIMDPSTEVTSANCRMYLHFMQYIPNLVADCQGALLRRALGRAQDQIEPGKCGAVLLRLGQYM